MSLSPEILDLFGAPIVSYTEDQAIEDGILHHLWPNRWPWLLVTNTLLAECERVALGRVKGRKPSEWDLEATTDEINTVLIPLVMDAIMETQRQAKLNPRCDLVELEHTAAGTVWIRPNAKGGMTIMKPEDN